MDVKIWGFMPIRRGSKGVPGKNVAMLAKRPLWQWAFNALDGIVSTRVLAHDYPKCPLNFMSNAYGFVRSAESATDDASPEIVINEWLKSGGARDYDIFLYTQATNPWVTHEDFDAAIGALIDASDPDGYVVGAARITPYVYRQAGVHFGPYPMFDTEERGNRQDAKPFFRENGSIYCTTIGALKRNGTHKGNCVGVVGMPEYTALEIDEPYHLVMARALCDHYQCTPTQIREHIG